MEEKKENQACCDKKSCSGMLVKIIIGIALIFVGLLIVLRCWHSLWIVAKGVSGPILMLAGLVTIAIAKE